VEYKKGEPKANNADELQLCAQAMCMEEMLLCSISGGGLYYGTNRRRTYVDFTDELREQVKSMVKEMHELWEKGYTPKVKPQKGCNACSLKEICVPRLTKTKSVSSYIATNLMEK
jgi:CRISPR-associated exonuclease Cas4